MYRYLQIEKKARKMGVQPLRFISTILEGVDTGGLWHNLLLPEAGCEKKS
jgi:hypothetical protein